MQTGATLTIFLQIIRDATPPPGLVLREVTSSREERRDSSRSGPRRGRWHTVASELRRKEGCGLA